MSETEVKGLREAFWDGSQDVDYIDEGTTTTAAGTKSYEVDNSQWYIAGYDAPWISYSYYPAKLRLTLTEILHMREVAKKDAALRKTFKKLTPFIEVEVDF
jgi:hypothetical protein